MFTITVKGRTLNELNLALKDAEKELNSGKLPTKVEKDLGAEVKTEEVKVEPFTNLQKIPEGIVESGNGVEVDSESLPWDKRIHASSKTKKKDGTWKLKRGVDQDLVEEVKKELKGSFDTKEVSIPTIEESADLKAPSLPNSTGHTLESFVQNFPLIYGQLISEGKIEQNYTNSLKDYYQVDQIWKLNDEQKAEVFNTLVTCEIISQVH